MGDYLRTGAIIASALTMLGVLAFCVTCCVAIRKNKPSPRSAYVALESPSVLTARNAFDRRVALAVHDAKQGSRVCDLCGFANVRHASSCVRCGSAFHLEKATQVNRSGQGNVSASVMVQTDVHRRIRRRHEWTRRVSRQGELQWHHDSELCDQALVDLPAHVLQSVSVVQEDSDPSESTLIEIIHPEEEQQQEEEDAQATTTLADISTQLSFLIKNEPWKILNAADSVASRIAFTNTGASRSCIRIPLEIATTSKLPFPTKLAHFITSVAGLVSAARDAHDSDSSSSSHLSIRRDHLLVDSVSALTTMAPASVRAGIRVNFVGEQGIDAGGVYREWFLLTNEAILTADAGVFTCVDHQHQTFYLNPHSREVLGEDHLAHFLAAGRLLGRALLDGNVTGFHLALPLLKIILGQPVALSDLEYFDPEVFKHLKWLLVNDGVDTLSLDFTVTEKLPDGTTRTVELVEGGADIEVTDANKLDFVDAKLKYLLFTSVSEQLFAFLTGVYEVVPAELLAIFDAEELDYVVSGSDEIDVDDWKANTLVHRSLVLMSSLEYFWESVRELSLDERRRLLQFATGSSRVPPGGFRALTSTDGKLCLFNLRGVHPSETRGYLHSHACFNRLDVPRHSSLELMREAVQAAISSESTGFTTA